MNLNAISHRSALTDWVGKVMPMETKRELKHCYIWTVKLKPEYKRLQYYFKVFCGDEKLLMFEDDFYTEETIAVNEVIGIPLC